MEKKHVLDFSLVEKALEALRETLLETGMKRLKRKIERRTGL
jgi:hypothetical protein